MSNEVAVNKNLPANIGNMATALSQSAVTAGASGGDELYMLFTKFGEWVFGTDRTEVEEGSRWAVNPTQFQHGFIAWDQDNTKNGPVGEMMVPASQPMVLESDLPQLPAGKWAKAVQVSMRCTEGEDEGVQVVWQSNSLGGRKAYASLLQAVVNKIQSGTEAIVPILDLKADSYPHKVYGKIFVPELKITGWTTMDGVSDSQENPAEPEKVEAPAEKAEEPEPEQPTRRRRKRAA